MAYLSAQVALKSGSPSTPALTLGWKRIWGGCREEEMPGDRGGDGQSYWGHKRMVIVVVVATRRV